MGEVKEFVNICVPSTSTGAEPNATFLESNINNQIIMENGDNKKRVPKRILQFSDGVLEEFSSDDEEEHHKNINQVDSPRDLIDPRNLTWAPFIWYQVKKAGSKTLSVCDYLGEHIADFLGITSPKYQYEIEEYFRLKTEEENQRKRNMEMSSWSDRGGVESNIEDVAIEEQPNTQEEKESGVYYTALKIALKKIRDKGALRGDKVGFKPARFY